MPLRQKREHLASFRDRYSSLVGRNQKSLVIDEACSLLGWDRKHAIKALNGKVTQGGSGKPRRRTRRYGDDIGEVVLAIWKAGGQPCGLRLKAMIPAWMASYEQQFGILGDLERQKLLACGSRTLEKLTSSARQSRTPAAGGRLVLGSQRIKSGAEIQASHWEFEITDWRMIGSPPGHGGARTYLRSLTLTDTSSGWRELGEILPPGTIPEVDAMKRILAATPHHLPIPGGRKRSEFVHETLGSWLAKSELNTHSNRSERIASTASGIAGYIQIPHPAWMELAGLAEGLYREAWLPLRNHFTPVMKAMDKVRPDGTTAKSHDHAASPYQRLMASADIPEETKRKLRATHSQLDPFGLSQEVGQRLAAIRDYLEAL